MKTKNRVFEGECIEVLHHGCMHPRIRTPQICRQVPQHLIVHPQSSKDGFRQAVFELDEAGKVIRLKTGENYVERVEQW